MPEKQVRATIPLLKAPVSDITEKGFNIRIGAMYGSPTTLTIIADTRAMDLRDGDILTIFTEILLKKAEGSA